MAKEREVLTVDKKQEETMNMNDLEIVKLGVELKKAELQATQGKITQYKTLLGALEVKLQNVESEHKAKLAQERQKFESERQLKLNELANREEVLRKGEEQYVHRKIALEEREAQAERINEERKQLFNEKLKYEQLNNEAQIRFNEANNLFGEAVKKSDEAAKKDLQADNKLTEAKNILSIVEGIKNANAEKENDIKKQAENLIQLRNEINPKIEEYRELVKKNEGILEALRLKEQELKDRVEENNKLFDSIVEREQKVKERELNVVTKEQELLRKGLLIENLEKNKQ